MMIHAGSAPMHRHVKCARPTSLCLDDVHVTCCGSQLKDDVSCFQTGRSQLRRYKAKKLLVSEGEASQPKAKSQVLEFWLVREYCDKGSLSVRFLHTVMTCLSG